MRLRTLSNRPPAPTGAAVILLIALGLTAACGSSGSAKSPKAGAAGASARTGIGSSAAPGDHQVSFVVNGTTTYGTLHIPQNPTGSMPAALLLAGSGPTDRNGNQPPQLMPDTLQDIATLMGDDGIMALRFDQYGSGQTGLGAFANNPSSLTLSAFVQQADAAYQFLAGQAGADPKRLLIAGHSQGGMIALEAGQNTKPAPAGLALLEPQDERLLDLTTLQLNEQLSAAVSAGQLNSAQAASIKTAIANGVSNLRAGKPASTTGMPASFAAVFQDFNTNLAFTQTDDAVYPPALAAKVPASTKVMVTCGTADTNVPCSTTGPLVSALKTAGTGGPGLVTLANVNHLLQPAGSPASTTTLAPAAQQAIHSFDQLWKQ